MDNLRYQRWEEPETADNAERLQAKLDDQGVDNTGPVCLEGFANGITCYGNPALRFKMPLGFAMVDIISYL